MCANDVVISRRVQMEREINTDATGNEVWVHRHMCVWARRVGGGRLWCCLLRLWRRRREGYTCMCVSLPPDTKPTSPRTLTSSGCWASHRKTRWPQGAEECVCGCIFAFSRWAEHTPASSSESQLSENTCESQAVTSQAHLASIWLHGVSFNCHYSCACRRACSLLSFGRTATWFHELASWTPTHAGLHSLLFK